MGILLDLRGMLEKALYLPAGRQGGNLNRFQIETRDPEKGASGQSRKRFVGRRSQSSQLFFISALGNGERRGKCNLTGRMRWLDTIC